MTTELPSQNQTRSRQLMVVFSVFAFFVSWYFFGLKEHWWFEDDPAIYLFASNVRNPFEFVFSKQFITGFGSGNEIAPTLLLSLWVDAKAAWRSAAACYFHNSLSLGLTTALFFAVCRLCFRDLVLASLTTLLWLFLPSTVAVFEFISTRNYLEGLAVALASILCVSISATKSGRSRVAWESMALTFAGIAFVSKEFFPTSLSTFLFLHFVKDKRWFACAGLLVLDVAYAVLRIWGVGTSLKYKMEFLGLADYLSYLARLPYIFSAGKLGYIIFLLAAGLLFYQAKTFSKFIFTISMSVSLLVTALLTIYPVAHALLETWKEPGTWYRSVFVLNTLLLVGILKIAHAFPKKQLGYLLIGMTALGVFKGGLRTRYHWNSMKVSYANEGQSLFENPDRVHTSTLPAYWYLPSLAKLYKEKPSADLIVQVDGNSVRYVSPSRKSVP